MIKRLQNKVAESKLTLPVTMGFAIVVWLLSGAVVQGWWPQMACFMASAAIMVVLNNAHALIRIFSRLVSSMYALLMCAACFLFPSLSGAVMQTAFIAALTVLFVAYQDKAAAGIVYYAFLLFGIAAFLFPQFLFVVPLLWLLMATQLQCLSWRTWGASILGLLTPFWFYGVWLLQTHDPQPCYDYWQELTTLYAPFDLDSLTNGQLLTLLLIVVGTTVGIVHYTRKHHDDKIRIRLLYGFFIWLFVGIMLMIALQPQHYNALLRMAIVCTAPLIAHFMALTSTRITNIACCCIVAAIIAITAYNLWTL